MCDATGVDPDTWQHTPEYLKGIYGLDRNASDLDVAGALAAKPYEAVIAPIQTIARATDLIIDARARAAFVHNLTPAVLGHAITQPWVDYYQGLQCRDAYLIGRGTVGIANKLLAAYGLYRGGQAVGALLRGRGAVSAGVQVNAPDEAVSSPGSITLGSRVASEGQQVRGDFPRTAGANEILYRADRTGTITHYQVYDPDGFPVMRVDITGRTHGGVPTPHVVEYQRNVAPDGTVFVRPNRTVRPANPDELP